MKLRFALNRILAWIIFQTFDVVMTSDGTVRVFAI